jgi:hypothetical protein
MNRLESLVKKLASRDDTKYLSSYGIATVVSYIVSGATVFCLHNFEADKTSLVFWTAFSKMTAFNVTNLTAYAFFHRSEYKTDKERNDDMKKQLLTGVPTSIANYAAKISLHAVLANTNLNPLLAFLAGYLLPGALAASIKLPVDYKNDLIYRHKK